MNNSIFKGTVLAALLGIAIIMSGCGGGSGLVARPVGEIEQEVPELNTSCSVHLNNVIFYENDVYVNEFTVSGHNYDDEDMKCGIRIELHVVNSVSLVWESDFDDAESYMVIPAGEDAPSTFVYTTIHTHDDWHNGLNTSDGPEPKNYYQTSTIGETGEVLSVDDEVGYNIQMRFYDGEI